MNPNKSDISLHKGFGTILLQNHSFNFLPCHSFLLVFKPGDNSWPADSPKVDGLPVFRSSLSKEYNEEGGEFMYTSSIGDASSRPIGTPYADTSYAYVHKNVLFITVDVFHNTGAETFDREHGLGGEGIVTCTVVGSHLVWFEKVVKEANKNPSIKHIFVQAHVPIIQPVRKINCSGQFFDGGKESEFWKIMRKYGVDVYFTGDVHANTATKDESSDLLQIVSRGNRLNNFIKVDVTDDGFTISSYNEVGTKWKWNGNYTKYGEITVDKSDTNTSIQSSGSLKVLDTSSGPLLRFAFDDNDRYSLKDRQIIGLKHDQHGETLLGHSITIRDETSTEGMQNYGVFGRKYFQFYLQSLFVTFLSFGGG